MKTSFVVSRLLVSLPSLLPVGLGGDVGQAGRVYRHPMLAVLSRRGTRESNTSSHHRGSIHCGSRWWRYVPAHVGLLPIRTHTFRHVLLGMSSLESLESMTCLTASRRRQFSSTVLGACFVPTDLKRLSESFVRMRCPLAGA